MNKNRKWIVIMMLLLVIVAILALALVLLFGSNLSNRNIGASNVYVGVAQARLFQEEVTKSQMFENADDVPYWIIPFGSVVEVCEIKGDIVKVSVGPKVKSSPSEAVEDRTEPPEFGWMYRYDLCLGSDLERRQTDEYTLKSPIRISIKTEPETGEYNIICAVPHYLGEPDTLYRPVWLDESCIGYTCDLQNNSDKHPLTHKENVIYYLDGPNVVELSILPRDFLAGNKAK